MMQSALFLLLVSIAAAEDVIITKRSQLPTVPDTNEYDVYFLEAPLFKSKYGNALAAFNGFHSGLSFWNIKDKTETISVQLWAKYGMMSAVVPQVSTKDGTMHVKWVNEIVVGYEKDFASDYWTRIRRMGRVHGKMLNQYFCWLPSYIKNHLGYQVFTVENPQTNQSVVRPRTCYEFCFDSLAALYQLGAFFKHHSEFIGEFVLFSMRQPLKVSIDDPVMGPKIKAFCAKLYQLSQMAATEEQKRALANPKYALNLMKQASGAEPLVFVYIDGKHYWMVRLDKPWTTFRYARGSFPHGKRNPASDPALRSCLPTNAPTKVPTKIPTKTPTKRPTEPSKAFLSGQDVDVSSVVDALKLEPEDSDDTDSLF